MNHQLEADFNSPKCVTCGKTQLCEFCLRYKIDNRLSFSKDAKWEPMKGYCLDGMSLLKRQGR
jgi:hypothetical protein